MRSIGLVIPTFVLVAMVGGIVFRKKLRFVAVLLVPLYIVVTLILVLGSLSPIASQVGYALPWQLPRHLTHHGRDYYAGTRKCEARSGFGGLRRVGWVFGYFTPARQIYVEGQGGGTATPTVLLVNGSGDHCLVAYELSGGP